MLKQLGLIVFLLGFGALPCAHAAKFANQFTEFELPPQWQCSLEAAEWVCQSTVENKKRDAIIVLAAKLKGDQDSIEQYKTYLDASKSYTSIQGKAVKSDKKYVKVQELNGQAWVDALHLDSELPGFYTRYLATVKQDLGILVTYSIQKDKYKDYLNDFETMVKTLKVFRKGTGINAGPASGDLFKSISIPNSVSQQTVFPKLDDPAATKPKQKDEGIPTSWLIGAALVLGFIIWRKRQSGG